jgi:hypothetical protein
MRRQSTSEACLAGSGRSSRLDPSFGPVQFSAHDTRADGNVRQIELHRERIVLKRTLRGMRMSIQMRFSDFIGVTHRVANDDRALVLVHRDPALSIALPAEIVAQEIEVSNAIWKTIFALPEITERNATSAPRRRRRNAVKWRHPRFLMRRRTGTSWHMMKVHRGEDEIIAPE